MTVAELIAELQRQDPQAIVRNEQSWGISNTIRVREFNGGIIITPFTSVWEATP